MGAKVVGISVHDLLRHRSC